MTDDDGQAAPKDRGEIDPARHLLASSGFHQLWREASPAPGPTVRMDEPVAAWRTEIDGATSREPSPDRVDAVVVSHARAVVLASLLRELAARLRPGLPVGRVQSDGSLSALAAELQEDMANRSWPR